MIGEAHTIFMLLAIIAVVAVLAQRTKAPPPIFLVVAGIGLALIPGIPSVVLAPDTVLLVFLPPLIYSAGVAMSWREFRSNLRPIALLAVGCVIFTTCTVAAAAHYFLGMDWAVGFVLGAIIAPPDVVAPLALARRLGLPRRLVVILEGEGLANDATALILYRFAVAAVATGMFSLTQASTTFALIIVGEIAFGIGVGWLSLRLRSWSHDPHIEIILSLLTPYVAYWVPEHLGGSGVLATVACGLYVSWIGPRLISAATRLQGIFFWDLLIYVIEGFVFLLTGLQARTLIERTHGFSLTDLLVATAIITAIVIAARFVWMFPATYVPHWVWPRMANRNPTPNWKYQFLLAFTGVRGVVSLAAALALPFATADGTPFIQREVILFITFGVILATLVGQGLMLPTVIGWLGLAKDGKAERRRERIAELAARRDAVQAAYDQLEKIGRERKLSKRVLALLKERHDHRVNQLPGNLDDDLSVALLSADVQLELIAAEREFAYRLLRDGKITDEARRRIERELDLEESTITARRGDHGAL
ncbi:MAG TPA: Na+/H+ antiporter [Pseudolabrys sp.]|nr:Na+/H+ antiporter [Pseudolabrys sp.]